VRVNFVRNESLETRILKPEHHAASTSEQLND
jgi:hypothetical protein